MYKVFDYLKQLFYVSIPTDVVYYPFYNLSDLRALYHASKIDTNFDKEELKQIYESVPPYINTTYYNVQDTTNETFIKTIWIPEYVNDEYIANNRCLNKLIATHGIMDESYVGFDDEITEKMEKLLLKNPNYHIRKKYYNLI